MRPFEFDLPSEKLARELNKSFSVLDNFSGMARIQAEVQRSLKPYQQMIDRNREMRRFAQLSSITGIAQAIQQVNKSVAYDGLIGLNKAMTQMRSVFPAGFQTTIATMARQQEAFFGKSLQISPFLDPRTASQLASSETV